MLPIAAHAQLASTTDPAADTPIKIFTFLFSGAVSEDSNLFRRPAFEQSETITTGSLGIRLDKPYGQQHFQLEANQTQTSYKRFKYLDFDALNYNGTWTWKLGTRLSGKLTASRSESLAPFEDTSGISRNVRINQNETADVDAWIFGGWHLLLGISKSDQRSEQNTLINRTPDFRSTSESAGVKYQSHAGNSVTFRRQTTSGEYVNTPLVTQNSDYTEQLSELTADWRLTANSSFNGRLGWLDRKNADVTRKNFSGPSSSLTYSWSPNGKLSLSAIASRNTSPLQDPNASYREENSFSMTPSWRMGAKTTSFLTVSTAKGSDKGVAVVPGVPLRRDTTNAATVGVNWTATRTLTIGGSMQALQRTSNVALADFDATIARLNASISF